MYKLSVTYKLGLAIILIILSVLFPLGFIINRSITNFYMTNEESKVKTLSQNYADTLSKFHDPNIKSLINGLSVLTQDNMIVIDKNGKETVNTGVKGLRSISADLYKLSKGQSLSNSFNDTDKYTFFYSASPIFLNNKFNGAIYVFSSIDKINQSLKSIQSSLIIAGIGAFLLSLGFTLFLSRRLSQPLLKMEEATNKIANGDLSTRVEIPSKDELGSLASAINNLAIDLDRYRTNRSEFLADISHELRTPITYLSGYANVLQKKLYKSEEEMDRYLQIIQSESKRLHQLIEDLFDLSKMEEGKIELSFEPVDLTKQLEAACEKAKLKAKQKQLKLIFHTDKNESHIILGDEFRFAQIIDNLLSNAIRYTEKGKIEISLKKDHEFEIIKIKDTGPGIPNEEKDYVFERFYRVEKSRSRNTGGTGLGLAIVKQLVLLHLGQINLNSELGKGTEFILTFPRFKGEIFNEMD